MQHQVSCVLRLSLTDTSKASNAKLHTQTNLRVSAAEPRNNSQHLIENGIRNLDRLKARDRRVHASSDKLVFCKEAVGVSLVGLLHGCYPNSYQERLGGLM
jgi:hypothetical protein